MSNIESDNSQNVGLEDYNNIFDGIFPDFTTLESVIDVGQGISIGPRKFDRIFKFLLP